LALARAARDQFLLDKVLIIPTRIPPHKSDRMDLTPEIHRARMIELAIDNDPGLALSRLELNRPGPSYTIDTLRSLTEIFPQAELFLIVGEDAFRDIDSWREAAEIRSLVKFIVAERPGFTADTTETGSVLRLQTEALDIASSDIRSRIESGEALRSGMVPERVEQYIQKMKLYRKYGV